MYYQLTPKQWGQIKDEPVIIEAIQKGAMTIQEASDGVDIYCNGTYECDCWSCVLVDKVWDIVLGEMETSNETTN